jgi:hypothetical protein
VKAISLASFIYTENLDDVALLGNGDKLGESAIKLAFGALLDKLGE